jgi:hypothetical protein
MMTPVEAKILTDVATGAAAYALERLEGGVAPEEAFTVIFEIVKAAVIAHRRFSRTAYGTPDVAAWNPLTPSVN